MTTYDVKRLALVLALQAEIEGMKATNENRKQDGHSMVYSESSFNELADQLRNLAYCVDEQL